MDELMAAHIASGELQRGRLFVGEKPWFLPWKIMTHGEKPLFLPWKILKQTGLLEHLLSFCHGITVCPQP
jgi:hypothetical protein